MSVPGVIDAVPVPRSREVGAGQLPGPGQGGQFRDRDGPARGIRAYKVLRREDAGHSALARARRRSAAYRAAALWAR